MTSESIRQRSDLIGTQVITRDTGNRLGIINQIWVDIDRREVIGFGIKDNILAVSALPRFMA
ncbi:MAG: PRC-barrel domain-containing protein, partial [Cyanobacteria bacterium P01_D01_bin.73]